METSREPQAQTGLVLFFLGKPHAGLRKLSAYYHQRGFRVLNIVDAVELDQRLREHLPHAILIDLQSRNDLREYLDVLRKRPSAIEIPRMAIISATTDAETAAAFRRDCDDTLSWPLKATDLSARLFNLLAERNQLLSFNRDSRDQEGRLYRGDIGPEFLRPLLQLLYLGRQDAMVSVESEGRRGRLWFKEGKLIDAQVGALDWEESLELVRRFVSGTFTISFQAVDRKRFIERNALQWLALQESAEAEARAAEEEAVRTEGGSAIRLDESGTLTLEAAGLSEASEKTNPNAGFSDVPPARAAAPVLVQAASFVAEPQEEDEDEDEEQGKVQTLPALKALRDEDEEEDEDEDDDDEDEDDDDDDEDEDDDDDDDDDDNAGARVGIKIGRMTRAELEQRIQMESTRGAASMRALASPTEITSSMARTRQDAVSIPQIIDKPGTGRPTNRPVEVRSAAPAPVAVVEAPPAPTPRASARAAAPVRPVAAVAPVAAPAPEPAEVVEVLVADEAPLRLDTPVEAAADDAPLRLDSPLEGVEPQSLDATDKLSALMALGALDGEEAAPPPTPTPQKRPQAAAAPLPRKPEAAARPETSAPTRRPDQRRETSHPGARRDLSQPGVGRDVSQPGVATTRKPAASSSDRERLLYGGIGATAALALVFVLLRGGDDSSDPSVVGVGEGGQPERDGAGNLILVPSSQEGGEVVPAIAKPGGRVGGQPAQPGSAVASAPAPTNPPEVVPAGNPTSPAVPTTTTRPPENRTEAVASVPRTTETKVTETRPAVPPPPSSSEVLARARAAESEGRSAEAMNLYAQALDLDPRSSEARDGVERIKKKLSLPTTRPGELHINAFPPGDARIYIDGEKVGYAPYHNESAAPRKYFIRVLSDRYGPCETSAEVTSGEETWVHLKLEDDKACNRTGSTVGPR